MKLDTYSTPPIQLRTEPLAKNSIEAFNDYFEMVPALSDELKNEVYKLRYQVYCIENSYENPEHYPDNLEFDEFDQHSVHYLIRHRKSGDYAATVRLILPDTHNPEKLFPLERHSQINNATVMQPINRKYLGEISRFCVSKAFKKTKNQTYTSPDTNADLLSGCFTLNERQTFPLISIALIGCFIKASHENNIHYLFACMEPSFFRFVAPLGINLIKIGPLVNHHGERWPAMIKISDLLDSVAKKKPAVLSLLTNKGTFLQAKHNSAQQH
jgi:N-acyl amino acid synthase of PEP-CTERM/exosortase system